MAREARLWQHLQPLLVEAKMRGDRVTDRARPGEPDVRLLDRRTRQVALVELKAPTGGTLLGLSAEQALFLRSWAADRGRGGVLVWWWDDTWTYHRAQPGIAWLGFIRGPQPTPTCMWNHRPTGDELRAAIFELDSNDEGG